MNIQEALATSDNQRHEYRDLEKFFRIEEAFGETSLIQAYEDWQAGKVPGFTVEINSKDPMDFRTPEHQGRLTPLWPSRRLGDFPLWKHAVYCGLEYQEVGRTRKPIGFDIMIREHLRLARCKASHIELVEDPVYENQYRRLLLPLRDGRISVCTRPIGQANFQAHLGLAQ